MNAAPEWDIVGTLPASDGGPKRHVAVSLDEAQFVVLFERLGDWHIKAGPWTFDVLTRCAENVVAGDKRALTWPDATLCMAAGHCALLCIGKRRRLALTDTEASAAEVPGSSVNADAPPAAGVRDLGPLPPAGAPSPPPPARCTECGG